MRRSKLELDPSADGVVRRIFHLALHGTSALDITKILNKEDHRNVLTFKTVAFAFHLIGQSRWTKNVSIHCTEVQAIRLSKIRKFSPPAEEGFPIDH